MNTTENTKSAEAVALFILLKHTEIRQMARNRAARCLREWRKDRNRHWRAEYRSAVQWDKSLEMAYRK